MILLDTLFIGGLKFVLGKIAAAVEAELNDDTALREELLAAQMRLELGEITQEQFAGIERQLLDRIREVRGRTRQEPLGAGGLEVTGVEASVWTDEPKDDDDGARRRRRRSRR